MPRRHAGEEEVQLYSFLTLAQNAGKQIMPWPLYEGKQPQPQSWSGHSGEEKKIMSLPELEHRLSGPWPSHYTNYATPALVHIL